MCIRDRHYPGDRQYQRIRADQRAGRPAASDRRCGVRVLCPAPVRAGKALPGCEDSAQPELCRERDFQHGPLSGHDGLSLIHILVRRQESYSVVNTAHPFTGIRLTERGLDYLENYVKEVRDVIGYEVPLAIDHFGHVCVEDCIRFARRMEPYNLAWMEDMIPWIYTDQYVRLKSSTTVPVCTGEDIYLKEGFERQMCIRDRPAVAVSINIIQIKR